MNWIDMGSSCFPQPDHVVKSMLVAIKQKYFIYLSVLVNQTFEQYFKY